MTNSITHIPNENTPPSPEVEYIQIHLKSEGDKLLLILPKPDNRDTTLEYNSIEEGLKHCLTHRQKNWPEQTPVHLLVYDRLLDTRQLQTIAEILQEHNLKLDCIHTSRRQTAVAAATSGYSVQKPNSAPSLSSSQAISLLAEPLYLKMTVRSGVDIRHPGNVIILGDVNPGGAVIADGDILIWGSLRGMAHAGAKGNRECTIMALKMEPTQLRIAERVARAPSNLLDNFEAEVAYIANDKIQLTPAYNFAKTHSFNQEQGGWQSNE